MSQNNITLAQLQLALERVKNYNTATYSELGHTHVTSEILKLTGFVMPESGDKQNMRVALSEQDSLNEALGKLDRSIFNIVENIGAIDVENHRHDDFYYTETEIDKMLDNLAKADETLEGDLQQYVQDQIAGLIDGAPDTLNTLNKIAEALRDNPAVLEVIEGMINDIDAKTVDGPDASDDGTVAIFDGTSGKKIKDSKFTIGCSVPSDAIFTDHNVQVDVNTTGSIFLSGCDAAQSKKHTLLVNGDFYIDGANNVLVAPRLQGNLTGKADEATNADTAAKTQSSLVIKLGAEGEEFTFDGSQATPVTITPSSIGAHDADYTQKAEDNAVENMLKELFPID